MIKFKITEIINRLRDNKISLQISSFSFLYGFWLQINPDILKHYAVYVLIEDFIDYRWIGSLFMGVPAALLIGIFFKNLYTQRFFTVGLTVLWSVLTVSFLLTPPPNTMWIFGAFLTMMSYEALWAEI